MKHVIQAALAAVVLGGCMGDETLTGYGAAGKLWQVQSIDGAPFTARATLEFPEQGRITGKAPCNNFTATQEAPYPWFRAGPIAATRMACPELEAETRFFSALEAMTLSEIAGDTMILSNDAGREMVFTAAK